MKFQTQLIHGNWHSEEKTGATNVPIYLSNAFTHKTANELEDIFNGRDMGYVYSRISNPTVNAFESRMALLEGGVSAVATSSGMAAIYLTLMNILLPGDEIIASSGVFGGTYDLFKNLSKYDIQVKVVDELNEETLNREITPKTKVVFSESIGNPKLDVLDIEKISQICDENNVVLIIDSTLTPPYLFKPLEHGADIVIHSTSKYINGTSNSIGGVIIDGGSKKFSNEKFEDFQHYIRRFKRFAFTAKLKNEIGKDIGAVLSPINSFLSLTGIETLGLRMKAHCENALKVAKFLQENPKVISVNYPGLEDSKYYKIVNKYYPKGAGGILTFRLGTKEKAFSFIDNLKLISNVTNIGDTKSLVIHPASTICSKNTNEEKELMGVYEDLVRVSVGIEDREDIIKDIEGGLAKL